ncbi:MAG: prepilin-type N-terminal cleavage/methylation domain-containing protein [Candidatus Izemoplasmataceae bacterium]
MIKIKNAQGVTLFELIVSILVGSIVLVTLTSTLAMITSANTRLQIDAKMENESYLISETLKYNLLTQLDKTFTVTQDDPDAFILVIDYCEIVGGETKICTWEDPNDLYNPHILMLEYNVGPDNSAILSFDGEAMHSDRMYLLNDSEVSFQRNNVLDLNTPYQYGLLTLHLNMQIVLSDGSVLNPKEYITQIIFSNY